MFFTRTHTLLSCAGGVFIIYSFLKKNSHIRHFLAGKIYTYEVPGQQYSDEVYSEQELEESLDIEEEENRKSIYGPWEESKNGD